MLIGIGSAVYLTQFTQVFKPKASENSVRFCSADSAASFRVCIHKVNINQSDVVEVQKIITCQKADNCVFRLENIQRPILITGKKGVEAGFKRPDWYDGTVLTISNSQDVNIGNLTFDDNKDIKCYIFSDWVTNTNTNFCQQRGYSSGVPGSAIAIEGKSKRVYLDNLKILYFKNLGVEVHSDVEDTVIQNSTFQNGGSSDADGRPLGSGWFGLWASTKNIDLVNNKFLDIQSNAVLITTNSTPQKRSLIKGNLFKNSAEWDLFNSGGGTVGILSPFTYTDFAYNEIIDGQAAKNILKGTTSYNGGVEIDVLGPEAVSHDNNLYGNVIHNIEGQYGIGIGNKQYFSNYNIYNNVIYDIRDLIHDDPPGGPIMLQAQGANINVSNNCENNPACPIPAYTTLTVFPQDCFRGESGQCSSTISWSSKSIPNLALKNRTTGVQLSEGANGSYDFSWFENEGEGVDLIANNFIYNSFVVQNGKLVEKLTYKGNIRTDPSQNCNLAGQAICTVKVIWDASNVFHTGIKVEIKSRESGILLASGIRGEQNASVNMLGDYFDLYIDGSLYDAIFVKGLSSSPSPAASVKPGDIDGNGKVDIFDFNRLVSDFGKTGTGLVSDIIKNDRVDIFDFNALIANFGK